LNLALQSELAHRRTLESELEQLRARVHSLDQEVTAVRAQRDRSDDELRGVQQRIREEYSSS
jgi:chaperonin cofactor prefoldin